MGEWLVDRGADYPAPVGRRSSLNFATAAEGLRAACWGLQKTNAWLATQAPSRSCDNFAALRKFYSLYALRCERESWICLVHESARARLGEGLPTTIACRESLPIPELQSAPN